MSIDIDVIVEADVWVEALPEPEALCRWAGKAAVAAGRNYPEASQGVICVMLADDGLVRRLNAAYRGRDQSTDVLSFPYIDQVGLSGGSDQYPLGDVVIAFGIAAADASASGKSLADHLCHLVIHGILHVLGYDHLDEDDAATMEGLETRVLASLGIADPYASMAITDNEHAIHR